MVKTCSLNSCVHFYGLELNLTLQTPLNCQRVYQYLIAETNGVNKYERGRSICRDLSITTVRAIILGYTTQHIQQTLKSIIHLKTTVNGRVLKRLTGILTQTTITFFKTNVDFVVLLTMYF
jgi:hypothetical protein